MHSSDDAAGCDACASSARARRELTTVAVLRTARLHRGCRRMHGKPIVAIFVCHSGEVKDGRRSTGPLRALGRTIWPTS